MFRNTLVVQQSGQASGWLACQLCEVVLILVVTDDGKDSLAVDSHAIVLLALSLGRNLAVLGQIAQHYLVAHRLLSR